MSFDPDAFLNSAPAGGFDPDAFLANSTPRVGMGDVQSSASAKPGKQMGPIAAAGLSGLYKGATLGDVWRMFGPGSAKYTSPPVPPRKLGESDRDYAARSAHAQLQWMGSPEGVEQGASMMAYTMPGGAGDLHAKPGTVPEGLLRKPILEKSPQAQLLESQGVRNLTVGQSVANPEASALASLEAATTKNPLGLGPQREAARRSWNVSEIAKSRKPGEAPLPQDVQGAFREAHARFEPEYEALGSHPVAPETVAGLPDRALKLPGGIDKATREAASKEIANALTVLPEGATTPLPERRPIAIMRDVAGAAAERDPNGISLGAGESGISPDGTIRDPQFRRSRVYPDTNRPRPSSETGYHVVFEEPPPRPQLTTGDLISVRKNIREAKRAAVNDPDRLRALGHAESVVTDALEKSLPGNEGAALRDADQRYATLMRAERAAPPGHSEFTPRQYLRSAERSSGRSNFKQGEAFGQDSGEAAQRVFEEMPFTGGRVAVLSGIPGADKLAAPVMRLLNTEAGKRLLFEARPRLLTPPNPGAAAGATVPLRLRVPRLDLSPATAEEDR